MSEGRISGDGLAHELDAAREAGSCDAATLAVAPSAPRRRREKVTVTRFFPRPAVTPLDRAAAAMLRGRALVVDARETDDAFDDVRRGLLDDAAAEIRTALAAVTEARGGLR